MPDLNLWHQRFKQQASWTSLLRQHLLSLAGADHARQIIEIGCGTGAVTSSLQSSTSAKIYGVDLSLAYLHYACRETSDLQFINANSNQLPFSTGAFDLTVCHFFLMWLSTPLQSLVEMRRVTAPGGFVIAFAEPDYGGRIDYPLPLMELGRLQGESLLSQGADPFLGRKLSGLFHQAGLSNIQSGILGGEWNDKVTPEARESEWAILQSDLKGQLALEKLKELHRLDLQAWQNGERVLFVPTFFAIGQV